MNPFTHVYDIRGVVPRLAKCTGRSEAELNVESLDPQDYVALCQLPVLAVEQPDLLRFNGSCIQGVDYAGRHSSRVPIWALLKHLNNSISINAALSYEKPRNENTTVSISSIFHQSLARLEAVQDALLPDAFKVYPIPNGWAEETQERFLRTLPGSRDKNRLLWTPVAIVLSWLNEFSFQTIKALAGKNVLVVDFGISGVEATLLHLKPDKSSAGENYVVPVRSLPDKGRNHFYQSYVPYDMAVAHCLSHHTGLSSDENYAQLLYGTGAVYHLLRGKSTQPVRYVIGNPGNYVATTITPELRDRVMRGAVDSDVPKDKGITFFDGYKSDLDGKSIRASIIEDLCPWIERNSSKIDNVVVAGSLADMELKNNTFSRELIELLKTNTPLDSRSFDPAQLQAAAKGAAIYGQREQLGLPTYYDTLPEYKVYAIVRKLGEQPKSGPITLVQGAVVRGGQVWRPKSPIEGFAVRAGSKELKITITRQNERDENNKPTYKSLTSSPFPKQILKDEPVLIYPEMKPACGFAKITIQPKDVPALFGENKAIVMDWDKLSVVDGPPDPPKVFSYPFVDATVGRLVDTPGVREVLDRFASRYSRRGGTKILTDAEIELLERVFPPYKTDQYDAKEGRRGAFSNAVVPYDASDRQLVDDVAECLYQAFAASDRRQHHAGDPYSKTCRLLGFMYVETSDSFVGDLIESFESGITPLMNEIIAAGRVFTRASSFEVFLRHFLALPSLPDTNLGWYWWSFFRCFYYYPDNALASEELVGRFYMKMLEFLQIHERRRVTQGGGPASLSNQIKFCLCAVLYGLRIREVKPDFLSKQTTVYKGLVSTIGNMFVKTKFPATMLNALPDSKKARLQDSSLNELVLRFLKFEATEDDIGLVADFTKTME